MQGIHSSEYTYKWIRLCVDIQVFTLTSAPMCADVQVENEKLHAAATKETNNANKCIEEQGEEGAEIRHDGGGW